MARKYLGWAYVSGSLDEGADGPMGAVQYKYGTENQQTGSANFTYITGSDALFFTGSIYVSGTVVSENYDVINHTVSYLSASGDSKFGDGTADQHQFTGSVTINGPGASALDVTGDTIIRSSGSSHLPKLILWSEDTTQADAAQIDFYRYGDGSLASGENLGEIRFWGSENNTTFGEAAAIIGEVDESGWSTGVSQAGRILFYTTPDGSDTLVERMRLTHSGSLGIGVTTPAYPLEVSGTINITSSFGTSQQLLRGNGTALLGIADENKDVMVGSGHSGKYLSFYTGNSELDPAMRITDAGYVGIGITSPSALLDISGDGSNIGQARVRQYEGAASDGPNLSLMKARGTQASPTIVSSGDHLGTIDFWGHDGSGFETGAKILAQVDGTPSDGTDMPGKLVFQTTPNASNASLTRMTIRQDGKIGMGSSATPGAALHVFGDITASFGITGSSFVTDGQVSASTFHGDGSNLTGIPESAGLFTAINGSSAYITSSVAIGTAEPPSGTLHVNVGAGAGVAPISYYDDVVFASDNRIGLSLLCPDNQVAGIALGSTSKNVNSYWVTSYSNNSTTIGTTGTGYTLKLASGQAVTALRIDPNQNVTCSYGNFVVPDDKIGIGPAFYTVEPDVELDVRGDVQIRSTSGTDIPNLTIWSDDTTTYDGAEMDLVKTGNSNTLSYNENLGEIRFKGSEDGTTSGTAAGIFGEVDDGTWTTGAKEGGRLTFWTTPNSSTGGIERMRINNSGNVSVPTGDVSIGLAAGVEPSGSLHIKSGSVNSSPHWTARTLVLEQGSDGYAGMTFMGTNAASQRIYLSSPAVGQHAEWISGYDLGYTLFGTSVAGHSLYLRSGNGAIGLHLDGNQNVTCSNGNFLVPDDKIGVGLADGIEPGAIVEVSGSGATPLLRVGGNDANNATIAIDAFAGYDSRIDLRENGDTKWSLRNDEPAQYFRITDEHSASALAGATVNRMTILPWKADGAAQIQVLSPSSTYNATGFNSGVLQLYSTSSVTSGQECTALQFIHRGEAGGSQKNRYGEMTLLSTGVSHAGSFTWKLRGSSAMSEVMRLDHNGHLSASQARFGEQPSFSVYANTNQTTVNSLHWMHVSSNVEHYDVGGGYNTTTCVYTAPETGTYMLTATTRMDSVNAGGYLWTHIETTDQNYFGDLWSEDDDTTGYGSPAITIITQMTAGDTAKVFVKSTQNTANTETSAPGYVTFQGHMLG